jgi:predicted AAA+ superfamily ATPase
MRCRSLGLKNLKSDRRVTKGIQMTKDQLQKLDAIFGQVSSAQTALVMLCDDLSEEEFEQLHKSHDYLTEAEIELCEQLVKLKDFGQAVIKETN